MKPHAGSLLDPSVRPRLNGARLPHRRARRLKALERT